MQLLKHLFSLYQYGLAILWTGTERGHVASRGAVIHFFYLSRMWLMVHGEKSSCGETKCAWDACSMVAVCFCLFLMFLMKNLNCVLAVVVDFLLFAMLQDGRNGRVASPEARRLKRLKGGVGDGGEAQWGTRHPRDVIEATRLLITSGYIKI